MATLAEIMAKKANGGAAKSAAPRITPQSEQDALAATIREAMDSAKPLPKTAAAASQARELGSMTASGERIPMDYPQDSNPDNSAWFSALHSLETSLCIVIEPHSAGWAWLAVDYKFNGKPLLLKQFPIVNRSKDGEPF